jgi:prepilin-type N-terminal cleavage/methylation domain-containing protein
MITLSKSKTGFTIIEVLIVLAIAGLILLVVFLAVPALQRSARNNGRRSDASRISAQVSDFESNQSGSLPGSVNGAAGGDTNTLFTNAGVMAQYTQANMTFNAAVVANPTAPATGNVVNLLCGTLTGANCSAIFPAASFPISPLPAAGVPNSMLLVQGGTCTNATTAGAGTSRNIALFYTYETGSGWAWNCISAS